MSFIDTKLNPRPFGRGFFYGLSIHKFMLLVPNLGENYLLNIMLSAEDLVLRLYDNDYTPVPASVLADFDEVEADWYDPAMLDKATWSAAETNLLGQAQSQYDSEPVSWTYSGEGTHAVYGYYVTTTESVPTVLWAERFDSPKSMAVENDSIHILLKFTAYSQSDLD